MEENQKKGTSKPVVEEAAKEGNKLAKENESNKQVDNKEESKNTLAATGGQESNVSLLSGLALFYLHLVCLYLEKNYLRSK